MGKLKLSNDSFTDGCFLSKKGVNPRFSTRAWGPRKEGLGEGLAEKVGRKVGERLANGLANLVGHFRLPLPLAFFHRFFFVRKGFFSWESLYKTLINTVFCVQLSQFEFPHAYALLPHPHFNDLKPHGRCPISASHFSKTLPAPASGKPLQKFLQFRSATPSQRKWPTLSNGKGLVGFLTPSNFATPKTPV